MNTKIIMTSSAFILFAAGIVLTFLPDDIVMYVLLQPNKPLQLLLQIMGALYFGFGMLNWMMRTSTIGGIYNKPIAIANFAHFFIAALALIHGLLSTPNLPKIIWFVAVSYVFYAIAFGIIFYTSPMKRTQQDA